MINKNTVGSHVAAVVAARMRLGFEVLVGECDNKSGNRSARCGGSTNRYAGWQQGAIDAVRIHVVESTVMLRSQGCPFVVGVPFKCSFSHVVFRFDFSQFRILLDFLPLHHGAPLAMDATLVSFVSRGVTGRLFLL